MPPPPLDTPMGSTVPLNNYGPLLSQWAVSLLNGLYTLETEGARQHDFVSRLIFTNINIARTYGPSPTIAD